MTAPKSTDFNVIFQKFSGTKSQTCNKVPDFHTGEGVKPRTPPHNPHYKTPGLANYKCRRQSWCHTFHICLGVGYSMQHMLQQLLHHICTSCYWYLKYFLPLADSLSPPSSPSASRSSVNVHTLLNWITCHRWQIMVIYNLCEWQFLSAILPVSSKAHIVIINNYVTDNDYQSKEWTHKRLACMVTTVYINLHVWSIPGSLCTPRQIFFGHETFWSHLLPELCLALWRTHCALQ